MSPRLSHQANAQRGTTLIEIIVVLALAALMMAVAIPTLSTIFGVDKRKASRQLAATMRWTYEEATIRNQPMRIAYDLDHNSYWVEAADSEVRIHKDWRAKEAFDEYLEEKQEADQRVKERAAQGSSAQQNLSELLANFQGEDGGGAWLDIPLLDLATATQLLPSPTNGGTLQETVDGLSGNGLQLTHVGFVPTGPGSIFGADGFNLPSAGANPPEAGSPYGAFWTVFIDPTANTNAQGVDLNGDYFLGSFWLLQ